MRFDGKQWSSNVSQERGNFDYIMGDDVDVNEPEVVKELTDWGIWYTETTGVDGFRLDAVKSIDAKVLQAMAHDDARAWQPSRFRGRRVLVGRCG